MSVHTLLESKATRYEEQHVKDSASIHVVNTNRLYAIRLLVIIQTWNVCLRMTVIHLGNYFTHFD